MGKKHKKHRSDRKTSDDQTTQPAETEKRDSLKMVFKILNEAPPSGSDDQPPHKKKKKRSHQHYNVQSVEISTEEQNVGSSATSAAVATSQRLSPSKQLAFKTLLTNLLRELERKDPQSIFAWPVNDIIAPNYSQMIAYPMDFSTMRGKIETEVYQSLPQFKHDFDAMVANCKLYNKEDTVYHRAAKKLKYAGKKIMSEERLVSLRRDVPALSSEFTMIEYYNLVGLDIPVMSELQNAHGDMQAMDTLEDGVGGEGDADMTSSYAQLDTYLDPNEPVSYTDVDSVRTVAPDSLRAAKIAADNLRQARPNDRIGALVKGDEPGKLVLNILNPNPGSNEEVRHHVILKDLTAVLNDGVETLPVVKEDKRNKITPIEYLSYGSYSSFAPTFDSRSANITQSQSDMLLAVYGGDTGYLMAQSMQEFVKDADPAVQDMIDDILDGCTHGGHRKVNADIAATLEENVVLLQDLQNKQNDRLKKVLPDGKPNVVSPSEKEYLVAGALQTNLTSLAKQTAPGALYDEKSVRACHGYAPSEN